jgi:hypothetical protein
MTWIARAAPSSAEFAPSIERSQRADWKALARPIRKAIHQQRQPMRQAYVAEVGFDDLG